MTEHDNARSTGPIDIEPVDQAILSNVAPRPSTSGEVAERIDLSAFLPAPVTDSRRYVHDRLRRLEDYGLVRRNDEREDGSHVWQLTRAGREAIGLE